MNSILRFTPLLMLVVLFACEIKDPFLTGAPDDPEELKEYNKFKITIKQGVSGTILFWEGNCMPGIGTNDSCKVDAVVRKIRLYEFTTREQTEPAEGAFFHQVNTKLVATAQSDEDGFYQVALKPGKYSMFIEEDSLLYANLTGNDGGILVSVVDSGWVTQTNPAITYKAAY